MRISDRTIEDIKSRLEIEEVVSDYLSLRRQGPRLLACCPFHAEKTPSFSVSPALGIYKCFGCGKGGDAISFVQEMDNLSYVEALVHLAQRYNIPVKYEGHTPGEEDSYRLREGLHALMGFAQAHYAHRLHEHEAGKSIGLRYFEERGLQLPTLQAFGLGYSLQTEQDLLQTATKRGYTKEQLLKAGLLHAAGSRDLFIGRILFPIHNLSGKVIAFGARALGTAQPKYINSPETSIYQKNKVLYGLYQARKALRSAQHVYIVEGYTDVLAMVQHGYKETVAVAGTALTETQARLLKRFVPAVTLLFDGDSAGRSAALRAIDTLLSASLDVSVVPLPKGEDPDHFLCKKGKKVFDDYLSSHGCSFLRFKYQQLQAETSHQPQAEAQIIHGLLKSIALVPDELARHMLMRHCSQEVGLSESVLWRNFKEALPSAQKSARSKGATPAPKKTHMHASSALPSSALQQQEAEILRIFLLYGSQQHPEDKEKGSLAQYMLAEMEDLNFSYPPYAAILTEIKKALEKGKYLGFSELIVHPDPQLREAAHALVPSEEAPSPQWETRCQISLPKPKEEAYEMAYYALLRLKKAKVQALLQENIQKLQLLSKEDKAHPEEDPLLRTHQRLKDLDRHLTKQLESTPQHAE